MALLSVVSFSCIENDIPYPIIKLEILGVEAEGLKSPAKIDVQSKSVILEFEEIVDIRNAVITDISCSTLLPPNITPIFNFISNHHLNYIIYLNKFL